MTWQMLVVVAQIGLGGAMVVSGFRVAAAYWLARRDAAQKAALERREGRPLVHRERTVALAVLAIFTGVVLLATAETTAEMLADRPPAATGG